MNGLEFYFFVAAVVGLYGYAFGEFRSSRRALLLTAALLPAVFLALEATTQFMTIDATNDLFPETAFVESSDMKQFNAGSFRTSELFLAPLARVLRTFVSDTHRLAMWLKGFHWLAGFLCLLAIHRVSRFFVNSERAIFFVAFFYTGLLLPTNVLALKVFNYDKLSLFFTVLGVVAMARAVEQPRRSFALLGVASLALAAQEKLIAAPILWLSLPVFAYLRMRSLRTNARWRDALISSLMAVATALAIHLAAYGSVSLARGEILPINTLFKPLMSVVWPITRTAFGIPRVQHPIWLVMACIGFTYAGALLLHGIAGRYGRGKPSRPWRPKVRSVTVSALVTAVFGIGVGWTFGGEVFVGPALAAADHLYQPTHMFNELFWHYGAASRAGHLVYSMAAYLAVFVHSVPSVIWTLIFFSCWVGRKTAPAGKDPIAVSHLLCLALVLSLLAPVFFALFQMPPGSRYFNVFIFLTLLIALLRLFSRPYPHRRKPLVVAACIGLLLVEVFAFRPLFGAFAPVWARETDQRFYATPRPGHLGSMLRWTGWGEEVMLAGRRIENRCRPAGCDGIRLFWAYPGSWLQPTAIVHGSIAGIAAQDRPAYDDKAYFVINRSAVVQQMIAFPHQVEPVDTIRFRGYSQAWIFRGDDLRKAGFRF